MRTWTELCASTERAARVSTLLLMSTMKSLVFLWEHELIMVLLFNSADATENSIIWQSWWLFQGSDVIFVSYLSQRNRGVSPNVHTNLFYYGCSHLKHWYILLCSTLSSSRPYATCSVLVCEGWPIVCLSGLPPPERWQHKAQHRIHIHNKQWIPSVSYSVTHKFEHITPVLSSTDWLVPTSNI